MNTTEQKIEELLRTAPRPTPPTGLQEQLIAQVRLPASQPVSQILASPAVPIGWLRRWWPVLAPAAVSLACAVGLTFQQMEIRDLKQAIQDQSRDAAAKTGSLLVPTAQTNDAALEAEATARTQQEIVRLRELANQLTEEVGKLEQLGAENIKLRSQLAAPPPGFLTPEETDALAKAKEKAESIACINNLKQLGLSVRVWAIDNGDMTPPHLLEMTNEMSTPKILVCPADHARQTANGWTAYSQANCSYEYLAPSAPELEPLRVLFRCPIHGHITLCDGSVQGYVAKQHPERLVQRDGKLYFDPSAPPAQGAPATPPGNPPPGGSNP